MAENTTVTIAEQYRALEGERQATSDRAELCARLTLPYAYPEENSKSSDDLNRGYTQGFGALLVNNLIGKLALSILPPSQPFYRLSPTQEAMSAVAGDDLNKRFEIEKALAEKEEGILRNINKSNFRASLYPALRLAAITGNTMIEKLEDGYRVINLRNFVVKRDYAGTVVKLIIRELLDYETLPEEVRGSVDSEENSEDIELFTKVELIDGSYVISQEILGEPVGNEITFKEFSEYFIDLGWNKIDGEDYRRSFVEDHLGSLLALEKLTTALYEGIAEDMKIVKLVNPNGVTSYEDFVDAEHGDAIIGDGSDITDIVSNNNASFQTCKMLIEEIKQELSRAFLVTGASIRDSERTTAEEVSIVASEVEASLGGVYTAMADDVQRPLVLQAMKDVDIEDNDDIDVIITTGVQALGRNVEMSKIRNVIMELANFGNVVGQEKIASYINSDAIISAIVANSGVASKEFVLSAMQKEQNEIAQKQDMLAMQMAQGGLPQAGQNVANMALPQGGKQ